MYNIRNGRNSSFKSAMHSMAQANIDLVILHSTKITNKVYMHWLACFFVVITDMLSRHHRGVVIFYK